MLKKTISLAVLALALATVSCKESAADLITQQDLKVVADEAQAATLLPKISLDKEVHDFGTINEGDVVETEFIVTNSGQSPLLISDAKGSCGCTVPSPPKEPIAPGESAPIMVKFNSSGKPGNQSKTVTLTTNTENGAEKFEIKATVTPKAQ